jgi:hypothetical protein
MRLADVKNETPKFKVFFIHDFFPSWVQDGNTGQCRQERYILLVLEEDNKKEDPSPLEFRMFTEDDLRKKVLTLSFFWVTNCIQGFKNVIHNYDDLIQNINDVITRSSCVAHMVKAAIEEARYALVGSGKKSVELYDLFDRYINDQWTQWYTNKLSADEILTEIGENAFGNFSSFCFWVLIYPRRSVL